MKTLNKESTRIFCELMEFMNGRKFIKIVNEPFMPLLMEQSATGISTPTAQALFIASAIIIRSMA